MGLAWEVLGIVIKAPRNIYGFGDIAWFQSQERQLTCFRFHFLSTLGHSTEVLESARKMIALVQESDLLLARKCLLAKFASILLEAQPFDEAVAVAKEAIRGYSNIS